MLKPSPSGLSGLASKTSNILSLPDVLIPDAVHPEARHLSHRLPKI